MVTVRPGDPTNTAEGYRLVMAGVSAFTSIATVTYCVALELGTPDATIAIFPGYALELGSKPVLFTETVSVIGAPGSTTPLVGITDIQAALCTAALKGTAPPVVVSVTVCGVAGVLKL